MSNLLRRASLPGLLVSTFFSGLVFSGCSDKPGTLTAFKSLNESLEDGILDIYGSTETLARALEESTKDSATARRATIWYAKALRIYDLTTHLYKYVDSLKTELKKAAAFEAKDGSTDFRKDDIKAVEYLFEIKGQGKELERKMYLYRDSVFAVDDDLDSTFRRTLYPSIYLDATGNPNQGYIESLFEDIPMIGALAMLTKFQHTIKSIENRTVAFCSNKTSHYGDYYPIYSAIIAQSSTIVQGGEAIEITAGVGAFSVVAHPEVTINGKIIRIGDDGAAIYKFKAADKPGEYTVPVKVTFLDQETGKLEEITKKIKYTVADMNQSQNGQ